MCAQVLIESWWRPIQYNSYNGFSDNSYKNGLPVSRGNSLFYWCKGYLINWVLKWPLIAIIIANEEHRPATGQFGSRSQQYSSFISATTLFDCTHMCTHVPSTIELSILLWTRATTIAKTVCLNLNTFCWSSTKAFWLLMNWLIKTGY